ncbi:MAG: hypothetical protein ACK5QH_11885 [Rubrivivax sp.]|jgi:hypothetical protein
MAQAVYPALLFTVALLVTTAYFLLGGLPLLVLDHSTDLDARFVHAFFNLYYKAAFVAAVGAALSFGLWGRPAFALGAAGLALTVALLKRRFIPVLAQWGAHIQARTPQAVRKFRQLHVAALLLNGLQLAVLVWALLQFSL